MTRVGILSVVLVAALTGACGGADDASPAPTGPSSTTTNTAPPPAAPPAQTSCVPTPPSNLSVASIQGTVVTLQWTGVSGAIDYTILVGSTPSSSDQLSTNTTNTSYTWTAKKGSQFARVQARFSCGMSGSSNEINYTVY
jgi:hypothetical protein